MCYSISTTKDFSKLQVRFGAKFESKEQYKPIYHASAFTFPLWPVISSDNPSVIDFYQWGLVPFWIKDIEAAHKIRGQTLNARAETIFTKPAFRHAIRTKRCLVLVDGFYEWRHEGKAKYPYRIWLKNKAVFALAGIWDIWHNKATGESLKTFAIITTVANPLLEKIHNTRKRMPVILRREDEKKWLNINLDTEQVSTLLKPYNVQEMAAHPVSRQLIKIGFNADSPEVMDRYDYGLDLSM